MKISVVAVANSQSRCKMKSEGRSFRTLPFVQGDPHSLHLSLLNKAQAVLESLLTGLT